MKSRPLWQYAIFPLIGIVLIALLVIQMRGFLGKSASESSRPPQPIRAATPPKTQSIIAEGRIATYPGAQVVVSTEVPGTIIALPVQEKDVVRQGQLIAELRADDLKAALREERARIAETDADLKLAFQEISRSERLFAVQMGTRQNLDRAYRDRDNALARRQTSAATIAKIETQLAKTRILSPIAGTVIARSVNLGETVAAGAPLATIADLSRTRVEAEVDEFDAGKITLGQAVKIRAEGFGDQSWRGIVEEIPDIVDTRRLKPQDPGKPSDTRVLLVKVALKEPTPLKLGQRVQVEVELGKKSDR